MIKRNGSYTVQYNEKMRGGEGVIKIEHLHTPDELYEKGRLYAKVSLEPGFSIGRHVHEGEMESFYILTGEGEVDDNGEVSKVYAGDSILTRSGEEHSISNIGSGMLEMIALILYK